MRPRNLLTTALLFAALTLTGAAHAQQLAKRLILKDGSYQLATQWEVKGDRVRYYSAERGEWEDVPNSMVDWDATDKFTREREAGKPAPEAVQLDKELEAEKKQDEARSPHVVPGLQLPEDGGVVILDTFENQPQLVELQQSGGEVNKNTKGNILRAAINPIASSRQNIEIPGLHAKVQAHATLPSIYVRDDQRDQPIATAAPSSSPASKTRDEELPWDRFRIVRMQTKQGKRIAGDIKIALYGKVSQEQKLVPTKSSQLSGNWIKLTPAAPLEPGEYAVVEMLGKEGMNLYVWDFGVNPTAPANPMAWKPDPSAGQAKPEQPKDLERRN
ncbi:MAG: hypothetical protein DMG90_10565 [Acidobacteria bacterium]|jgi:hypothetical protein|nr:MAG: hypothetical protein DMG91_01350 [Acidobacteriota bacterium]PYV89724.1 MAG: hypothetical protein DMG90_10565 [Acidobacteriota bacterium]